MATEGFRTQVVTSVDFDTALWLKDKAGRENVKVPELVRRIIADARKADAS